MDIFSVLSMLGGLALFLYGMNVMSSGLEKMAGGKLESIFERLTSNPFKSVLLGAAVTAVIQSSSASTVMVVGFVNAGIMKLRSAIGIIMGVNIGTTVTAWILSLSGLSGDNIAVKMLKPASFAPIVAVIGVALIMFSKSSKKKDLASILVGFAVLMFGMTMMGDAVEPLKENEQFANILLLFQNPFLGVLAGALLTAIIQSSSASVGILQSLSSTGAITFGSALPIILGQNIGTCVTAMLSSVGTSKNARRVAIVHLYFNVIGTVLFLGLFYILNAVIGFGFIDGSVDEVKIAVVHTIFNVSTTLILLPFTRVLEKLAYITIKGDPNEKTGDFEQEFRILDERFLQSPSFAVEKCRELTMKMGEISIKNIKEAINLVIGKYDKEKSVEICAIENVIDVYEDKLGTYLVKISSQDLSENDSRSVSTLLHLIGDFERISDHAQNIAETATERYEKKSEFTPSAEKELKVMIAAVDEILDMALAAFCNNDIKVAQQIEPLEETIDNLRSMIKNNHIARLKNGECTIENGFILNDLLTDLERTSDHCSNIAVCIIEENAHAFDIHEYINVLKNSGKEFKDQVEEYMKKYAIQST
ncbi:MAG: Na/Pi cotransporter family protein [Ruminococcus sp.]|nr:Na/Pi cotransporter family protein [Ruminococcus sp.]